MLFEISFLLTTALWQQQQHYTPLFPSLYRLSCSVVPQSVPVQVCHSNTSLYFQQKMSSMTSVGGRAAPEQDVRLATTAELATIRRLAQVVARVFYDDRHIVLVDQLIGITVLPADVLAHRLGIQVKELAAMASKLVEDKLLCNFRRNEIKDNIASRTFQRTYYYLDYKLFLDVTKWRMMTIRKQIDMRLRNELDNKGYVCPRCKKSFSTLEVAHLLDMFRNIFVCDTPGCNTELVDNEEADDVKRSKDSLMRFNEQLSNILNGLRASEGIALPPLDIASWLTKHAASQPWYASQSDDQGLATASSTLVNGVPALQVDLSSNDPAAEAARRLAKQKSEDEQRKQNALPAWHLASTVSGEQTSLGRRQERLHTSSGTYVEDKKEDDDADDDDYYAQYASLQSAEQEAKSKAAAAALDDFETVDTPITSGQSSSRKRSRSPSQTDASADNKKHRNAADNDEDEEEMDDFEDVV